MTVGVRPIPPDREASSASNYSVGTPDGSRPAWFNMNTYRPQDQFKYTTDALVLHESVPGHHLQVGLARELPGLPEFRRAYGAAAFSEGWALYAESLGQEIGAYRDAPSRFGQLASEQFRAVRLVVDTGIHAMGWSRDRAREYFALHAPSQSLAEVDRYIARPGQALAYKLGQLKILELRRKAQQALGSKFDIREFSRRGVEERHPAARISSMRRSTRTSRQRAESRRHDAGSKEHRPGLHCGYSIRRTELGLTLALRNAGNHSRVERRHHQQAAPSPKT
jgi:uncharacterized protein (DUF885 family)